MPKINKIREIFVCEKCNTEKNETHYYFSRIQGQKYMKVCKDCFVDEFINSEDTYEVLKKYNIPFIKSLWDCYDGDIRYYIKTLNSLPQYRKLEWKDSEFNSVKEDSEKNFYESIVKNLKNEATKLNQKLEKVRSRDDMNLYISTLKSLRETLDLIHKYDWKMMCSEYKTVENGTKIYQISVWEQNHDNQIRNHKIWNVIE